MMTVTHLPHTTQGKDPEYDCTHPGQMARIGNPVTILDYCLNDLEGHHTGGPPSVWTISLSKHTYFHLLKHRE